MTDKRYFFLVLPLNYQQLLFGKQEAAKSGTQETSICKVKVWFFSSENNFYLNNYLENNTYVTLKTFLYNPSFFLSQRYRIHFGGDISFPMIFPINISAVMFT